jgi:hypothetical protein
VSSEFDVGTLLLKFQLMSRRVMGDVAWIARGLWRFEEGKLPSAKNVGVKLTLELSFKRADLTSPQPCRRRKL